MRVWVSAVCILFSIQIPVVDQPPVAVVRDSQAIAVIQQSIVALGGSEALTQVQSVIAQGSIVSAKGASGPSGNFVWEDQFVAKGHEFKASFQSASDTQLFVSGHGNPGLVSNGKTTKFTPYVASTTVPIHLPGVVLLGLLANTDFNISFLGSVTVKGQPAIQIHLQNDKDILKQTWSVQDWYFDPNTLLPLRVDYRIPDTHLPLKFTTCTAEFSNYKVAQNLTLPLLLIIAEDGDPQNVATITDISINPPVSSSDFDLPTGAL